MAISVQESHAATKEPVSSVKQILKSPSNNFSTPLLEKQQSTAEQVPRVLAQQGATRFNHRYPGYIGGPLSDPSNRDVEPSKYQKCLTPITWSFCPSVPSPHDVTGQKQQAICEGPAGQRLFNLCETLLFLGKSCQSESVRNQTGRTSS